MYGCHLEDECTRLSQACDKIYTERSFDSGSESFEGGASSIIAHNGSAHLLVVVQGQAGVIVCRVIRSLIRSSLHKGFSWWKNGTTAVHHLEMEHMITCFNQQQQQSAIKQFARIFHRVIRGWFSDRIELWKEKCTICLGADRELAISEQLAGRLKVSLHPEKYAKLTNCISRWLQSKDCEGC